MNTTIKNTTTNNNKEQERKGPPPVLCSSNWKREQVLQERLVQERQVQERQVQEGQNDQEMELEPAVQNPEDLAIVNSLNERIKLMAVPIANCLSWIFTTQTQNQNRPVEPIQISVNMIVGCSTESIILGLGKNHFTYDLAHVHSRTECTALYLVNFLARHYCENNPNILVKVSMNYSGGSLEIKTSRSWVQKNNK